MNRISRTAMALALSTTLFAATAPALQARTLPQLQVPSLSGGWLDATLAWVGDLVSGKAPHAQSVRSTAKSGTLIIPPLGPIHGATPMTCSTIDPNGVPNCHGGI
jgi:hypothetical protein